MKITFDFNKSIDENASEYFTKSKKSKKKLVGAKETLQKFEEKNKEEFEKEVKGEVKFTKLDTSKKPWFEKFHWFISSDNYFIVAGRDATTNEIVIKKHTSSKDLVFHTDMAGSPFAVIKSDSKDIQIINEDLEVPKGDIPKNTIDETAAFVAMYAKAWKLGLSDIKVFYVNPEQVSKEANSGEYLAKGSFMIRGKTNYSEYTPEYGVGIIGNAVMCAPLSAIRVHCKTVVQILQGNEKTSVIAKKIKSILREKENIDVDLDSLVKILPAGGCEIKKERLKKY